jgi:uncharacterized protein
MHVSQMSNKYIKDPNDIVSVGDNIKVKIMSINKELKRISLALVQN